MKFLTRTVCYVNSFLFCAVIICPDSLKLGFQTQADQAAACEEVESRKHFQEYSNRDSSSESKLSCWLECECPHNENTDLFDGLSQVLLPCRHSPMISILRKIRY